MVGLDDFDRDDERSGGDHVATDGEAGERADEGVGSPLPAAGRARFSREAAGAPIDSRGQKSKSLLRGVLGEEVFTSWFKSMEFEGFDGQTVRVSVPVKFLKNWIQAHYSEDLLACCAAEFPGAARVEVVLRQPGTVSARPAMEIGAREARADGGPPPAGSSRSTALARPSHPPFGRTHINGFEGSPLDPRYTLDSFIVGPSNRMAHAGAVQVAEMVRSGVPSSVNPLYIHSSVGLGKTHLLQAIAWEVQRRSPAAQVLYLTAERFRFQFVEALRSSDPLAFKDKFRQIDILLIDDLEFLHGAQTEQEFDHIINQLLDSGRQVVVASARAPSQIEKLNERMRSRLQRGLVTEIGGLDKELRLKIIERRIEERRSTDRSFEIGRDVVELLAERLTDSGRELEGAVTRLHATWQYMKTPISVEVCEQMIRDLVHGSEPRRIKIDEILKVVSRHFGVSRGDILSQRRHRSVVWPRQIGMYLAKRLTSRSLPEIGRRFGGRDHTTVLHAIRKIENELAGNSRLKDEIEDLMKMLSP